MSCVIPANPDAAGTLVWRFKVKPELTQLQGIGVRTSVYVQAFLPVLSALLPLITRGSVLDDTKGVVGSAQSGTVALLTGVALIVSSIIQAKAYGLSMLHALVVLNLCWVTVLASLSPFAFVALKLQQEITTRGIRGVVKELNWMGCVFCLKLTLMGCYGIWVLHQPMAFDTSPESCTASTVFYLLGHHPLVVSPKFRIPSLVLYSLMLVPGFNVAVLLIAIFPFLVVIIAIVAITCSLWDGATTSVGATPTGIQEGNGSTISSEHGEGDEGDKMGPVQHLALILTPMMVNVLVIVMTEMTMKSNNIGGEDRQWSLGQTFAALVALIPAFTIADQWRKWLQARYTNSTGEEKEASSTDAQKKEDPWDDYT